MPKRQGRPPKDKSQASTSNKRETRKKTAYVFSDEDEILDLCSMCSQTIRDKKE